MSGLSESGLSERIKQRDAAMDRLAEAIAKHFTDGDPDCACDLHARTT